MEIETVPNEVDDKSPAEEKDDSSLKSLNGKNVNHPESSVDIPYEIDDEVNEVKNIDNEYFSEKNSNVDDCNEKKNEVTKNDNEGTENPQSSVNKDEDAKTSSQGANHEEYGKIEEVPKRERRRTEKFKMYEESSQSKQKGNVKKKTESELVCICEVKYEKGPFYIACDYCDKWFHGTCVGITQDQASSIDMYKCSICIEVSLGDGNEYEIEKSVDDESEDEDENESDYEIHELESMNDDLKSIISKKDIIINENMDRIEELKHDLKVMRNKLEEEQQSKEKMVEDMEKQIGEMKKENNEKDKNIKKQLSKEMKQLEAAKSRIKNLEETNIKNQDKINTLTASEETLRKLKDGNNAEIQTLGKQIVELTLIVENYEKINYEILANKMSNNKPDDTVNDEQSTSNKLEKSRKEDEGIKEENKRLKKEVQTLKKEVKIFKERSEQLEEEEFEQKKTIASLNKYVEELTELNKELIGEEVAGDKSGNESDINDEEYKEKRKKEKNEVIKDEIRISNYGQPMTVENITELLGLNVNKGIAEYCNVVITEDNDYAIVEVPDQISNEIIKLNGIEIDGKILGVEIIKKGKGNIICYYYNKYGKCRNGDKCNFKHINIKKTINCRYYLKGRCKFNERCNYKHPTTKENEVCNNYKYNRPCKFNEECKYVCYKDQQPQHQHNQQQQKQWIQHQQQQQQQQQHQQHQQQQQNQQHQQHQQQLKEQNMQQQHLEQ